MDTFDALGHLDYAKARGPGILKFINKNSSKKSNTWDFFKDAAVDYLKQKAVKIVSLSGVVASAGLVLGSNLIIHGGDHPPKNELVLEESETPSQKSLTDSPSQASGLRAPAGVTGASRANSELVSPNDSRGDHASNFENFEQPHAERLNPTAPVNEGATRPTAFWRKEEAPLRNETAPTTSATSQPQDSNNGGAGAYVSGSPSSNTTAPLANAQGTTASSINSLEANGQFSPASTTVSSGFAIVTGGSLGTGTGMQVDAVIGQVTSPNVQNGTGLTLVSGLAGPVMLNF